MDVPGGLGEREQLGVCALFIASGFSQTTCLPAASVVADLPVVEMVGGREVHDVDALVGEHRLEGLVRLGQVLGAAFSAARAGLEPTMPVTSTPRRRSASTWTTPMKPVPATAARMFLNERRRAEPMRSVMRVSDAAPAAPALTGMTLSTDDRSHGVGMRPRRCPPRLPTLVRRALGVKRDAYTAYRAAADREDIAVAALMTS